MSVICMVDYKKGLSSNSCSILENCKINSNLKKTCGWNTRVGGKFMNTLSEYIIFTSAKKMIAHR